MFYQEVGQTWATDVMVTLPALLVRKNRMLFLPQDSVPRKLRCLVRSEADTAFMLQSCYWKSLKCAVREEAGFLLFES